MSNPRIEPWLDRAEYAAFKELAPDDPALPATYEAWLEQTEELVSVFIKSGVPVEKVYIKAGELGRYCREHGINPDGVGRAAFAVHKACAQRKKIVIT
jgi:hypothetical protein